MSIATQTSTLPLEPHDAPRTTLPEHREGTVETVREPADPLDVELDNPYDNVACTD